MKKIMFIVALLSLTISADAQFKKSIDKIVDKAGAQIDKAGEKIDQQMDKVIDKVTDITPEILFGTWTFVEPKIFIASNNAIKQLSGKLVHGTAKKQLTKEFDKMGIGADSVKFSFDDKGNFSAFIKGRTVSGQWKISLDSRLQVIIRDASVKCTAYMSEDYLCIIADKALLIGIIENGSEETSKRAKNFASIAKGYQGYQLSLLFKKEEKK